MRVRRRLGVTVAAAVLCAALAANGLAGTLIFARAKSDPLARADAIVVLAGEHDGREAYGIQLAERGYADTVLLSDPYDETDDVMRAACRPRAHIKVICHLPPILTTRGEAMMTREFADRNNWQKVIIVSWRYHLPRARKVFDQCFTAPNRSVIVRETPRPYQLSVAQWQYTYLYQFGGWAKADLLGCSRASAI